MTTYEFIANGNLSDKDRAWFERQNDNHELTGGILSVNEDGCVSNYVIFKRGEGDNKFFGVATDWDENHIVYASYLKYLLIDKLTGCVEDADYAI